MTKPRTEPMSDAHKAALAEGREQGRFIRAYLEALESNRPKRGRKRTAQSIEKRLAAIDADLATVDPLRRVQLIQERYDLAAELGGTSAEDLLPELEAQFIAVAAPYGERKGIGYDAWREVGVPAAVLSQAGIKR